MCLFSHRFREPQNQPVVLGCPQGHLINRNGDGYGEMIWRFPVWIILSRRHMSISMFKEFIMSCHLAMWERESYYTRLNTIHRLFVLQKFWPVKMASKSIPIHPSFAYISTRLRFWSWIGVNGWRYCIEFMNLHEGDRTTFLSIK